MGLCPMLHKYRHNYFSRQRIAGKKDANRPFINLHSLETAPCLPPETHFTCILKKYTPKSYLNTTIDLNCLQKKIELLRTETKVPYTATHGNSIDEMINILIISITFEILVS